MCSYPLLKKKEKKKKKHIPKDLMFGIFFICFQNIRLIRFMMKSGSLCCGGKGNCCWFEFSTKTLSLGCCSCSFQEVDCSWRLDSFPQLQKGIQSVWIDSINAAVFLFNILILFCFWFFFLLNILIGGLNIWYVGVHVQLICFWQVPVSFRVCKLVFPTVPKLFVCFFFFPTFCFDCDCGVSVKIDLL